MPGEFTSIRRREFAPFQRRRALPSSRNRSGGGDAQIRCLSARPRCGYGGPARPGLIRPGPDASAQRLATGRRGAAAGPEHPRPSPLRAAAVTPACCSASCRPNTHLRGPRGIVAGDLAGRILLAGRRSDHGGGGPCRRPFTAVVRLLAGCGEPAWTDYMGHANLKKEVYSIKFFRRQTRIYSLDGLCGLRTSIAAPARQPA